MYTGISLLTLILRNPSPADKNLKAVQNSNLGGQFLTTYLKIFSPSEEMNLVFTSCIRYIFCFKYLCLYLVHCKNCNLCYKYKIFYFNKISQLVKDHKRKYKISKNKWSSRRFNLKPLASNILPIFLNS